jgi:3-hydroxyisobutyrate dehydrogenase
VIDMTTSEPALAEEIATAAAAKSVESIDAPVSGGIPLAFRIIVPVHVGVLGGHFRRRW